MSFGKQLDSFVRKTEDRLQRIFRESVRELIRVAQAGAPVDTGLLRASLTLTVNDLAGPPQLREMTDAEARAYAASRPSGDTEKLQHGKTGDSVTLHWLARYAVMVEFGSRTQHAALFVQHASMKWPEIVNQVAKRVK